VTGLGFGGNQLVAIDDRAVGTTMSTYCRAAQGLVSGDTAELTLARRDGGGISVRRVRMILP
jgi:hypothetical protein